MRRIGLLQVHQESNSFNPGRTSRADYERYGVATGPRVLEEFGETGELGGFREGLGRVPDIEPVGIARFQAWPSGPVAGDAFRWISDTLRRELAAAGSLDGVLCSLHGALMAEGFEDADGELLETIRSVVGSAVPVVATLDLHADVTPRMVGLADVLVPYHTSPHLDQRETGVRAARVMLRLLDGARPRTASVRLPMISISEAQNTFRGPLAPIYARLPALEAEPRFLAAGILMTQGWLDVPRLGWSTLVTTDGDPSRACAVAEELAAACWDVRHALKESFLSAAASVERAIAHGAGPVIIADGADATNSGAPGDSTHLLAEMVHRDIPGGALAIMVDPESVAAARTAGVGGVMRRAVGGRRDHVFSRPLPVEGTVERLGTARYVLSGHGGRNLPVDMGMSAVVRVRDVRLLLVEAPGPGSTPLMYRCIGLEPKDHAIVIVKSPAGFRAEFGPFASLILLADCPGCASPRYAELPYTRINRPLWPIDPIAARAEAPWAGREVIPS
jgi:microcystin degradation protein MlrC